MLTAIYKGIKAIVKFITTLGEFIFNFVKNIALLIGSIPKAVSYLTSVIGVFPFAIMSLLTLLTFILVLKAILGRGR